MMYPYEYYPLNLIDFLNYILFDDVDMLDVNDKLDNENVVNIFHKLVVDLNILY